MDKDREIIISNRYRIVRKIASGGMADIYLGQDIELDRKVAVKVLSANYAGDRNFVARFRREAQVLTRLDHPNIVDIYDWGKFNSYYYIVMEFVEGISLKELIDKKGSIEPGTAAKYAVQICDALGAAHDNNLIHRDIKPQNILISPEGEIKVTDFGIAKSLNTDITRTINIVGTAHYISPEQARGDVLDSRTDIYSLGIVIYEMITGDLPFRGDTSIDISLKHVNEKPVKPTQLVHDIPKKLENIVMLCLKKDPSLRYPGIGDLKLDLENYLGGKSLLLGKTGRDYAGPNILAARLGKNSGLLAASIMAIVFLGLFIVYTVLYYQKQPETIPEIRVPPLQNTYIETAEDNLSQLGLKMVIAGEEMSDTIPPGYIVEQAPEAGSVIEEEGIVEVFISSGSSNGQVVVPNLAGLEIGRARQLLEESGLEPGSVESRYSDYFEKDDVINQYPEYGTETGMGESVDITVSSGQEAIVVPNIIGIDLYYALRHLESLGITVLTTIVPADEQAARHGIVMTVEPRPGSTITSDDIVRLGISFPGLVQLVPAIAGSNVQEAILELESLNIAYEVIYVAADYSFQEDEVLHQWPEEGIYLPAGSPVLLFVGE
jgi:eukaryotic-like serine/threonine-protein kinase